MRKTIQGVVFGALVAAGVSVLLAQTPTWTTPRTWALDDLLTAQQFNSQFRDNLLWLRQDAQLTGTAALLDLGCGTLGTNEVLFADCTWATIPDFDLHDTVTQSATIVDADRLAFSDEGTAGDPMRFSTAANLADYMQTEVELSANRVTSNTFSEARLGTGTASTSNVLKGGSGTTAVWGPVSVDPDDIGATNTPSDGDLPFYDSSSGEVTWQPIGFGTADFSLFTAPNPTDNQCPTTAGGTVLTEASMQISGDSGPVVAILGTSSEPIVNYDVTFISYSSGRHYSVAMHLDGVLTILADGEPDFSVLTRITGQSAAVRAGAVSVQVYAQLTSNQASVELCPSASSIWRSDA